MLLELIIIFLGAWLVGTIGLVLSTVIKNHLAHQYFRKRSPGLPVVRNPNVWFGNSENLVFATRNWQSFSEHHDLYGKSFGFYYGGKAWVSSVDLDLLKTMMIDEANDHINRDLPDIPVQEIEEDCILFANNDQWRKLRKAIAPAFTKYKIKSPSVQAEVQKVVDRYVDSIEKKLEAAKEERGRDFIVEDQEDQCHRFALDIVFTTFYKQDNVIDYYVKKDAWTDRIESNMRDMANPFMKFCVAFPILKPILNWFILNFHRQGYARREVRKFMEKQTELNYLAKQQVSGAMKQDQTGKFDADNFTLKDGTQFKRNLVDYVVDQFLDGKLTRNEYFNSSFFLLLAGNKTSADAISKLIYHLAIHQDVQTKLRNLLLTEGIETEYLQWVIDESLRLFPPALIGCSRATARDFQTESGLIPANTFIITPAYTIHRLPEYWGPDANEFKPDRWRNAKNFHPMQYLAFGAGKRNCPGRDFAMQEIKMLIDVLLRKYKFEKSTKTNESMLFKAPYFIFMAFDLPTYIKISRLNS